MADFFDVLARNAEETINSEYYETAKTGESIHASLKNAVLECDVNPIITEIKAASPSSGVIRTNINHSEIAKGMQRGGAAAISVLTEPKQFNGSLEALAQTRKAVKLPILMKDIVLNPVQVFAASKMGANAVLLIKVLFDRGYGDRTIDEMINGAHMFDLEVLLETHTASEFHAALKTDADLIGINNRNLGTLKTDLNVTKKILTKYHARDKIVVSESGINTSDDIRFLRESGARAFLVGSAIMSSENIEKKVRELVNA